MHFNIELSDEALLDIQETRDYYFKVSPNILLKFDTELIEIIDYLQLNPSYFQKRYRNIKIFFTKNFPFGIHYLVDNNTIYVQRVLHQKRFYK